jgi:hypothetical protein
MFQYYKSLLTEVYPRFDVALAPGWHDWRPIPGELVHVILDQVFRQATGRRDMRFTVSVTLELAFFAFQT